MHMRLVCYSQFDSLVHPRLYTEALLKFKVVEDCEAKILVRHVSPNQDFKAITDGEFLRVSSNVVERID